MKNKSIIYYFLPIVGFILVSVLYFYPVLQGKEIYQSDIVQYIGMSKETKDFRQNNAEETYWNNSAFGGMPTYQLGAKYPHNYIKKVDSFLRFLPRPADYLFLYLLGFYILLLSLKIKPIQASLGTLLFGFSTYLIIILGVGHNAKAHAIAYMPWVVAGIYLVYQKKYTIGALVTFLVVALEIQANHFQMTYYLLILLLLIAGYYSYYFIKEKKYKHLIYSNLLLLVCGILAIGVNATNLMATSEYAKYSTRGKSELTLNSDGSKKLSNHAMSYDYITEYSYGVFETLNLFSPKVMGGASHEKLTEDSNSHQFVSTFLRQQGYDPSQASQITKNSPTYWGAQPIVAAPAYIGAVVIFLAILALFVEKRKIIYVLGIGSLLAILLSWGKNFPITPWLINYLPLYDKFRAIASIQVIAELCIPAMAVLGLSSFVKIDAENQKAAIKKTAYVVGGLFIILIIGYFSGSFEHSNDGYIAQMFGNQSFQYTEALISDRKSMYIGSMIRSLFFVLAAAGLLYAYMYKKIKEPIVFILITFVAFMDLVLIDKNYVNAENFVPKSAVSKPFEASEADKFVQSQPGYFRVFDISGGFNNARASYFHQNLGGYHAAKPRKVQELADYQLSKNNLEILNMYNVKYILRPDENGNIIPMENPEANGNAWFVSSIQKVNNADETMQLLEKINTKSTAIASQNFTYPTEYKVDSLASIQLVENLPNKLVYKSKNTNDGFAVFSENYYKNGWNATIDNQPVTIEEVDYTLRGIAVPSGEHTIVFKFEPKVIQTGSLISLISSIIALIFIVFIGYLFFKRNIETK